MPRPFSMAFPLVLLLHEMTTRPVFANPTPERINALVQALGDDSFRKRESAEKELAAIGEKALPALKLARASAADLELRQRSRRVILTVMLGLRKSKSVGLETSVIDEGAFEMGSPPREFPRQKDEIRHRVQLTKPFLIGSYEVTQEQFEKVMKFNPSWFVKGGGGQAKVITDEKSMVTGRFPVEKVTWFDAIEFCNRLSKLDGYEPYYKFAGVEKEKDSIKSAGVNIIGGNGYRLPTEAEWEYACRGGTDRSFHFGTANTGKEANLRPGPAIGYGGGPNWPALGRTTTVGSYAPNHYGLHDMHGNAAEWCWDWYDRTYAVDAPPNDPPGPDSGKHRVLRGGSWMVDEGACRCASRFWLAPGESESFAGFRVARSP